MNRYRDWFQQARANLDHARTSAEVGHYSWACFAAQQAAEAALKGMHLREGQIAWGHSLIDLLGELPGAEAPPETLLDAARSLDQFYIPTRYPDAHPAGSAARHYTAENAASAVRWAEEILGYAEGAGLED